MMTGNEEILRERVSAMTEEEQRYVAKAIPLQILYEEIGERLYQQGGFISRIVTTVKENT
nr:MAG TPA: hypothetical protein [Caudoviricetes sp.]